jgi:hypothetical protein
MCNFLNNFKRKPEEEEVQEKGFWYVIKEENIDGDKLNVFGAEKRL